MTAAAIGTASAPAAYRRRRWSWRPLIRNPLVLIGLVLVVFFVAVALLADSLVPRDPVAMNAANALEGPSLQYPFGLDRFGRDVLSRAIYGTRISLMVSVGSITLAALIG